MDRRRDEHQLYIFSRLFRELCKTMQMGMAAPNQNDNLQVQHSNLGQNPFGFGHSLKNGENLNGDKQ